MSARPQYAELVAKLLERQPLEVPFAHPEDGATGVDMVRQAMRGKARRKRMMQATIGALALAAGTVALLGARTITRRAEEPEIVRSPDGELIQVSGETLSGEAVAVKGEVQVPLTSGLPISQGDRVLVKDGSQGSLKLSTGTQMLLEERADVTVLERGPTQIFSLKSGALRADVAKLHDGQRFIVATPDAEVEVRGTSFRLARVSGDPACSDGVLTKLFVYEGTVVARMRGREDRVPAGQSWSGGCVQRASAAPLGGKAAATLTSPVPAGTTPTLAR